MKETDEGFAMILWKKENERKFPQLKDLEDIPVQFGQFKNYFHRANPKDEGGRTYIDIYIKHTRPFAEIREDLSYFFPALDQMCITKIYNQSRSNNWGVCCILLKEWIIRFL